MRILEERDVVQFLQSEVEKAGTQIAWAEKHGVDRVHLNKVLNRVRRPSDSIIRALGLRTVFVSD